jgi:NADH-quinone oxidoreductase subunit C
MTPQEVGARLVALLGVRTEPPLAVDAPVAVAGLSGGQGYARATVDVPPDAWLLAVQVARDDIDLSFNYFDWLSAVDELPDAAPAAAGGAAGRGGPGAAGRAAAGRGAAGRAAAAPAAAIPAAAPAAAPVAAPAAAPAAAPVAAPGDGGFTVVAHLWSTAHRHGVLLRTRVPRAAAAVPSIVAIYPGAAWHERETYEMFGIDFPGHPGGLRPLLLPPEFEGHPLRKEFVLASRVAKAWPGAKEPGESDSGTARRAPMRPPGVPDPAQWGPRAAAAPATAPAAAPAAAPGGASAAAPGGASAAAPSGASAAPSAAAPSGASAAAPAGEEVV